MSLQTLATLRTYGLLVFFVVLFGGVLLLPGKRQSLPAAPAMTPAPPVMASLVP